MKRLGLCITAFAIAVAPGYALDDEADRLEAATTVVREILDIELLQRASPENLSE